MTQSKPVKLIGLNCTTTLALTIGNIPCMLSGGHVGSHVYGFWEWELRRIVAPALFDETTEGDEDVGRS